ncbi:SMC-Scp complex subunit ScpB [Ketogulonicigenium vulgare]|uniref:Predicted transcriptional regulator containing the HTH domain protein n=1 Tax=Ketogulonicigenium vulgare (strain WSH-001) TaxID=759362 RepID=F9Y3M0_KETVW|nr:SMC-Scp complex subunit ScpB [Ketogulonicigenium vulgare]AEM41640.1 predicted transcriptional regulator containing the HTH domain protein [Ketogulonicigenium vulgare WSH-001]AOZ55390.1 putative transcriptional regulator containing the HTH domain protein [Ketogulonicigenium vulgare]
MSDLTQAARMLEAVLFASRKPLNPRQLAARLPEGVDIQGALAALLTHYAGRGVELVRVGEAYAFRTAGDLAHLMREEVEETRKLSRAGIETLAIIAYHQPVTRAEIEDIRGVSVNKGTLDQLIELEWVRLGRRRLTPGRPVTYVVTETFLDQFGLETARDLPDLKEMRAAGLLESRLPPVVTVKSHETEALDPDSVAQDED